MKNLYVYTEHMGDNGGESCATDTAFTAWYAANTAYKTAAKAHGIALRRLLSIGVKRVAA